MFLHRLFSTVILLAFLGGMIFLPQNLRVPVFYAAVLLITYFLTGEMANIFEKTGFPAYQKFLKTVLPLIVVFLLVFRRFVFFDGFFFEVAVIFFALLFTKNDPLKIRKIFSTAILFFLIEIPIYAVIEIYFGGECEGENVSYNLVFLFFILATKIGDIGAYVTGTLSSKILKGGNHKLVPSISPGKSWEGMFGGWIISILFCCAFIRLGLVKSILGASILGTVFFFAGMAGDLTESVLKRAAGIKDSGKVFPGIGGIYDLVDSLLMTSVVFYFILHVFSLEVYTSVFLF